MDAPSRVEDSPRPVPLAETGGYSRRRAPPNSLASRAEWRRRRHEAIQERGRRLAERDAFLESALEPGEQVAARSRNHPLVTDRRILDGTQLIFPPRRGEWVVDEVPWDEVTGWSFGERHDHRPILRLEHRARVRIEHVPARRFLWFRVGERRRAGEQDDEDLGVRQVHEPGLGRDADGTRVSEDPARAGIRDPPGRHS